MYVIYCGIAILALVTRNLITVTGNLNILKFEVFSSIYCGIILGHPCK